MRCYKSGFRPRASLDFCPALSGSESITFTSLNITCFLSPKENCQIVLPNKINRVKVINFINSRNVCYFYFKVHLTTFASCCCIVTDMATSLDIYRKLINLIKYLYCIKRNNPTSEKCKYLKIIYTNIQDREQK